MSSQPLNPGHEAAIWARLMQASPQKAALSLEAAEFLLTIGFDRSDRERMQVLAERSSSAILTSDEQAELDGYLHVGNLLAVMQSKARAVLKRPPKPPTS